MAIGEETLLDAPVTPAPIFAYRALRAVFLGEQDTPEQPARRTNELDGNDKHDRLVQNRSTKAAVDLTPNNKRKHSALFHPSPTKSILRTPGAHTPRRALLRDVNVTFKDLRKSASPELVQKRASLVNRSAVASDDKENRPVEIPMAKDAVKGTNQKLVSKMSDVRADEGKPAVTTASQIKPAVPTVQDAHNMKGSVFSAAPLVTTTSTTSFDADTFMRTTEKEMKKLIKYGQRMRECARKKDAENTKLQSMVDELRRENERLKRQLEASNSNPVTVKATTHEDLSQRQSLVSKPSSATAPQLDSTKWSHHFDPLDLEDILSPRPQYKDTLTRSKRTTQHSSAPNPHPPTSQPDPEDEHSPQKRPRRVNLDSSSNSNKENEPHQSQSTSTKPPRRQSQHIPIPLPLRTNSTSNTRLAPDRLAAARARVQKRAEMRKASTETESEGVAGHDLGRGTLVGAISDGNSKTKSSGSECDNKVETSLSLLDWADL